MTHARNIKDLAIALEALTRVQGVDAEFKTVRELLDHELDEYHAANRSNRTKPNPYKPFTSSPDENEIPF